MAMSTIYLCKGVPLTNRYEHTIYFTSAAAQQSYFNGKTSDTLQDVTYLRKSWAIKVPLEMDVARQYSYLFFRNGTGKYWYYFVTDVQYINDNTTELSLELDVLQTYMFDWTLNPCFIEREHTASDVIGEHTIDEGLETGELISQSTVNVRLDECCIMIMTTVTLNPEIPIDILASRYNGIFGGAGVYAVDIANWTVLGEDLSNLGENIDAIIAMWMYPKKLVTLASGTSWTSGSIYKQVTSCTVSTVSPPARPVTLNGYTPKNKKLLQYPYNLLYATNHTGGAGVYKYEYFTDPNNINFGLLGTVSPEGVAHMYPKNYKGVTVNYEEGIQVSGFPSCAWNVDTYKLWLAQNQNQQNLSMGMTGLQIAAGVVTAGIGLGTGNFIMSSSGVSSVQSLMAQKADMELQPPQSRGNHSGSLAKVAEKLGYSFYAKTIDAPHARAIDDFFTMYGYAVHRVKTPTLKNRPAFTYIKTHDSNVTGNIPQADLNKINQIFDAGITFWVNGSDVGNYSVTNTV